jgi:hypothetical protein
MTNLTVIKLDTDTLDESYDVTKVYTVVDSRDRTVGFVASKDSKGKNWGFTLIEAELKNFLTFPYGKRKEAVEALVALRGVKADTSSIKVIK